MLVFSLIVSGFLESLMEVGLFELKEEKNMSLRLNKPRKVSEETHCYLVSCITKEWQSLIKLSRTKENFLSDVGTDGTDSWKIPLWDADRFGNDTHLVPSFPRLCSGCARNGSDSVRTCEFKSNSFNLDRATRLRDSVLLKSWDLFSDNLFSISSECWWCILYWF